MKGFPDNSVVKNLPAIKKTQVWFLGWEDRLEDMATHSSNFAWRIPGTEEPGWIQFIGSQSDMTEWLNTAHKVLQDANLAYFYGLVPKNSYGHKFSQTSLSSYYFLPFYQFTNFRKLYTYKTFWQFLLGFGNLKLWVLFSPLMKEWMIAKEDYL